MALGIFRKIGKFVKGIGKGIAKALPVVGKIAQAAAPALSMINPTLGTVASGVATGANVVNGIIKNVKNQSLPQAQTQVADSPFIKFKKAETNTSAPGVPSFVEPRASASFQWEKPTSRWGRSAPEVEDYDDYDGI